MSIVSDGISSDGVRQAANMQRQARTLGIIFRMERQTLLDHAFRVTPEDREVLRSGKIPASVLRQIRSVSRTSFPRARSLLIVLVLFAGVALGSLVPPYRGGRAFALLLSLALSVAIILWVRIRDWSHERRIWAKTPPLRVLEGSVETIRTWEYGYGDCYHLWSALNFVGQSEKPVCVFEKLNTGTISGWARLYLTTVPSRKLGLAPYYEAPVAIEIREDTTFVERQPSKPPPDEPLRVNVPAD